MSFFVDDFFDELGVGTLADAKILAKKWNEIFLRKELVQNAEVFYEEEGSRIDGSENGEIDGNKLKTSFLTKTREANEVSGMSDEGLKFAATALLSDAMPSLYNGFNGKRSSSFKSCGAKISVAGAEENDIEICYKKGNAEIAFYFNGDDLEIDGIEESGDEYDTGIYIFQKLYMALKIDGNAEIEFRRIRKKDRHAIRENDVTLTEFLERFASYYSFTDFPEDLAEHALRFMQRLFKVAERDCRKKAESVKDKQAKAEEERKKNDEAEFQRKESLLAAI